MNPIVVYDRLAEVSEDFFRTITHLNVKPAEQCALEALWVRLDDLIEQLPEALREDALSEEREA